MESFDELSPAKRRLTVVALFLGLFLVLFMNAMGNIVGAYIAGDLQNMSLYTMMYSIYYLCNACSMPFSSKLGEKFGRKPLILFGILLYGAASTLAGFAPNMEFHVVMRGCQGLGQGFIIANILACFAEFFDEAGRAKSMGMYGTLTGVVWIIAPITGGIVGDLLGWRPVFYAALPLAIVVFLILLWAMPNIKRAKSSAGIDWAGELLLIIWVTCIVFGLSWMGTKGIGDPSVIGLLVAFAIAFVLFLLNINRSDSPIITPGLFKNREYRLAVLAVILIGPSMFVVGSYMSAWVIAIVGGTATEAGVIAAVKSAVQMVLGVVLGAFIGKHGHNKLFMLSTAVVYIISNLMIGWSGPHASMVVVYAACILSGYCTTVYSLTFTLHGQNNVSEDQIGEATSNIQFIQSLAGTLGLSLAGMALTSSFTNRLANVIPDGLLNYASADQLAQFTNANVLTNPTLYGDFLASLPAEGQSLFTQMISNIQGAYSAAMGDMYVVVSILCAIAFVCILMMKDTEGKKASKENDNNETDVAATAEEKAA